MELEAQLAALEKEKEKLQEDLQTTQSSLESLQQQNVVLQEARDLAEAMLKEALEEASKTEELLTLAEERYSNSKKAYKVLMKKKAIPVRAPTLVASSSQMPTSEGMKKIRKLLSNSREENVDLVEQVQEQEKELYEARQEM